MSAQVSTKLDNSDRVRRDFIQAVKGKSLCAVLMGVGLALDLPRFYVREDTRGTSGLLIESDICVHVGHVGQFAGPLQG